MATKKPKRTESKKLTPSKWMELVEEKIYEEQHALIQKEVDKKTADAANYGWGVAGTKTHLGVATKVYGSRARVLSSTADFPSLEIDHDWREY